MSADQGEAIHIAIMTFAGASQRAPPERVNGLIAELHGRRTQEALTLAILAEVAIHYAAEWQKVHPKQTINIAET